MNLGHIRFSSAPFAIVAIYPVREYIYGYICGDGYLHVSTYILICMYLFSHIYICAHGHCYFSASYNVLFMDDIYIYVQCNCCSTLAINLFSLSLSLSNRQFFVPCDFEI